MSERGTVFLVDDDAGLREAISTSLQEAGLNVRSFESAEAFLQAYALKRNACLVLDIRMIGMSGIELQQELLSRDISIPILFITGYASIPQSVQAIKAGAIDFLEKPVAPAVLLSRIQEALSISRRSVGQPEPVAQLERFEQLTPREQVVSTLVAQGFSNKEIARQMELSFRTVEKYRASAMKKLQVSSSVELARAVPLG